MYALNIFYNELHVVHKCQFIMRNISWILCCNVCLTLCVMEGLRKYASACTEQVMSSHVKLSKYLCPFKSSWASMTYIKLRPNIQYLAANVDCKTVILSWVHWGRIQWCVVNSIKITGWQAHIHSWSASFTSHKMISSIPFYHRPSSMFCSCSRTGRNPFS